jgi:wyosine [tRNA(Phe)-imidazoG37] synthetase (radical SAM superfamily)
MSTIAFGPVPSRRLGHSLGINNIPPKTCTYSCIYCQLGRTNKMRAERCAFLEPERVLRDVQARIAGAREVGEPIDYLAFVPDGEPTLDLHLGRAIALLKPLGIKIAVITNASLLWREDVRADLMQADWVSLKVDAARREVWRRVDRPHGTLRLPLIRDGLLQFARSYGGELVTETMLVEGVNTDDALIREVAQLVAALRPSIAYLSVPTRPPAEAWVRPPAEESVNRAYQILSEGVERVEFLIGYEGNAFAFTGNAVDDLLSITAVHPMRQDAVSAYLARAGTDWSVVRDLVARDQLVQTSYRGAEFYLRRL